MATMLLRIEGLEKGNPGEGREDVERLEAVLRAMPGVFGVVVSTADGCAEVDIEDDEVDYDRVLERVREAGFEARLSG